MLGRAGDVVESKMSIEMGQLMGFLGMEEK